VDILLQNLSAQIAQHLLFLRCVSCIEIYRCRVGEKVPILLKRASAKIESRNYVNDQFLMKFFDKKSDPIAPDINANSLVLTSKNQFYDKFASTRDDQLPTSSCFVTIAVEENGVLLNRSKFFIVSGIRGGSAKEIACDPSRRHLKLVPVSALIFIGVAFCFCPQLKSN
jgi:hypothetical protein